MLRGYALVMSLDVSIYRVRPDGDGEEIPLDDAGGNPHLAGFERWRREMWGSAVVRSWGCHILPELAVADVYARGARLEALGREAALLEARLNDLAMAVGVNREVLGYRLGKIRRAVAVALKEPPGSAEVRIW